MSSKIWPRVFILLILGLILPFLFIYFLFESLGISEHVWPILFPILATTFGIIIVIFIFIAIACKAGSGITTLPSAIPHSYGQTTFPRHDIPSTGASYVIPLYCPHCKNQLELDKVEWIGSSELTCPRCYNVVQARVREDF